MAGAARGTVAAYAEFEKYEPVYDDRTEITGRLLRSRHADLSEEKANYLAWLYTLFRRADLLKNHIYILFQKLRIGLLGRDMHDMITEWIQLKIRLTETAQRVFELHLDATVNRPWATESFSSSKGRVDGHASKAFEFFVRDLQAEHGQDCKLEIQIFEAMRTAYFANVNLGIIAKDQRMIAVSKIEAMEHYIKKALNLVDRMIITHNMVEAGTGRRKNLAGAAAVAAAMAVQSDTWKQKLDKMMALHNVAAVAAVAAAV